MGRTPTKHSPKTAAALARVVHVQRGLDAAEEVVAQWRSDRADAIRAAVAAGASPYAIAKEIGRSAQLIYAMLEERTCSAPGCDEKVHAKGLCPRHYVAGGSDAVAH